MSVASFDDKHLEKLLQEVTLLTLFEWQKDVTVSDFATTTESHFELSRKAAQLARAQGTRATQTLFEKWPTLNAQQRMLTLMVACDAPHPDAIERLLQCVAEGTRTERQMALSALETLGDASTRDALEIAAKDAEKDIRERAFRALRSLGVTASLATFEAGLEDSAASVRLASLRAMAEIAGARSTHHLLNALDDPQYGNALFAQKTLRKRHPSFDLLPRLVANLDVMKKRGRYARPLSVELLGKFKDERCVGPLVEHLENLPRPRVT